MAARTWEVGLYLSARAFKHYITKWNQQLAINLSPDQYAAVQSCLTCVLALLKLLPQGG